MPARGPAKNLALTAILIAPIAAVALLIWWIFNSLAAGPAMNAPAVGAGANDTGGANAFGEELAGNDADAIQRTNRLLREGALIDPARWPAGLTLTVPDPGLPDHRRPSIAYQRNELESVIQAMARDRDAGVFTHTIPAGNLVPRSPIYVGIGGISIVRKGPNVTATDGEGAVVAAITLEPTPTETLEPDEPIVIDLSTLGVTLDTP